MKKCRKILSMLLALTVLLTNLVIAGTIPAAAADYADYVVEKTLLDEDFEDYTKFAGTTDEGDMSAAGYTTHINYNYYATPTTIDGDKAVKLGGSLQYNLPAALTEGVVRITFSERFTPESKDEWSLELKGTDSEKTDGVLAVQAWEGKKLGTKNKGTTTHVLVNPYTARQWYDFEVIVNLDTKKYDITVSKDGDVLKTYSDLDYSNPDNVAINGLQRICMRGSKSTTEPSYVDDLKIEVLKVKDETTEKDPNVLLDDDFEDAATLENYTTHIYNNTKATLATIDGDQAVKLAGSLQYNLPNELTEGVVKITYSERFTSESATDYSLELKGEKDAVDGVLAVQAFNGNTIGTKEAGTRNYILVQPYTPGQWYDFEVIVNLDTKKYDITVSKDGSVLKTYTDLDYVGFGSAAISGLKRICMRNFASNDFSYVDDLKVEILKVKDETTEKDPNVLLDDDFEDYTKFEGTTDEGDMYAVGYTKHIYSSAYSTPATIDGDQAVKLNGSLQYNLPNELTEGVVKITYSERFTSENVTDYSLELKGEKDNVDGVLAVQAFSGNTIGTKEAGTRNYILVQPYTPGQWYDFEVIVNLDTKKYDITVSKDGSVLKTYTDLDYVGFNGAAISGLQRIGMRCNATEDFSYVDDLKVEILNNENEDEKDPNVLLDDDFESYTSFAGTTDEGDMSAVGYTKHVYSGYGAVESIDGDKAVKLAKDQSLQYNLNSPITSGTVKISYSGRFGSSGDFNGIELKGDTAGVDGVITQTHSGKYISTNKAGVTTNAYTLLNGYTADAWYDFEILVNLDKGTYNISLYKDGTEIKTLTGLPFTTNSGTAITQLASVAFRSWGNNAYIDNLKIEILNDENEDEKDPNALLDDDFENNATLANYTTHIYAGTKATLATIDGDQAVKLGGSLQYNLPNALTEGVVKITYSERFTPESKNEWSLELKGTDSESIDGVLAVQAFNGTTIGTKNKGTTNHILVKPYTANEWYDFEVIVNLDTKKYDITVSKDGSVLKTYTDLDYSNPDNVAINGLQRICMRGSTSSTEPSYVDDLKVEILKIEKDPNALLDDDFENNATLAKYTTHIYAKTKATLATIDGDKAVKLNGSLQYNLPNALTVGLVKITYSERFTSENVTEYSLEFKGTDDETIDGVLAVQAWGGQNLGTKEAGSSTHRLVSPYTAGQWYDFEVIVNLDTAKYDITVSKDGNVLKTYKDLDYVNPKGTAINGLQRIGMRGASSTDPSYVDDLKIEYFPPSPTLSAEKISIVDIFGNETNKIFDGVTPIIKTMTLNFGCELDEASFENAVTLTSEKGEAVQFTGAVNGMTYVMTFDESLKAETKYTLNVASTIANIAGAELGTDVAISFTTGIEPIIVEIEGIYNSDGTTEIENPDVLTASSSIFAKLKYDNMADLKKSITCLAAYYDAEGRLIDSEIAETISVSELTKSETTVEFATPEDVSDISAVKVFTWDSTVSLKPLAKRYFICDNEWKGSGELSDDSAFNLVTTFYDDEGTTRGFAWSAITEHEDMAIRYAQADDNWYGENIIEDAVYTEYDGRLYYKADIKNLEPGETYVYKIGDKQDDVWSDFYTFTTEPEGLTEFSFVGVTDAQSNTWSGGFEYYKKTLDEAFEDAPDAAFMVNLGDMVNDGNLQPQWDGYFKAVKGYAESIPHMAVVGNHETRGDENTAVKNFSLQFNNPKNGTDALGNLTVADVSDIWTKGVIKNIEETVYSFDYGNAHFVVLNSGSDFSESSKTKIMTEQAKWLDKDLEASDKKWKIVMLHQGMYPAKTERYDTRDELTEVVDKHGVDLVLSGHDHMVTRTYPMSNGEIVETANPASVTKGTGMINAILGSAGPKRYTAVTEIPNYMAFLNATASTQPTYSLFNVNDERISVVTKQIDGTVVDSFEILDK